MIYAFTEEEKRIIEKNGCMVIQFKRDLKRWREICEEWERAWTQTLKAMREFAENLKSVLDDLREWFCDSEEHKFQPVPVLSKCNGQENLFAWKLFKPYRLARSRC